MPFPLSDFSRQMIEKHFRKKSLIWNEEYFLNVLSTAKSKHDVYNAILALRDCGTIRAVAALKEKINYPMQDVQSTAILTIAHIARAAETPFYADTLLNPSYRQKGYALWAITDAGDNRAVDAVMDYFGRNMSKLKSGKLTNASLPDGLDYLQRHMDDDSRISHFFSEVRRTSSR
jgi:HEAT repeat protein